MNIKDAVEIREKLYRIIASGVALNHPTVVKTSQELDKYVTAFYRNKAEKANGFRK